MVRSVAHSASKTRVNALMVRKTRVNALMARVSNHADDKRSD
jgi:hypothetical protein